MKLRDTFVYILMPISKLCSFHKVQITEYYNPLFIVQFYNSKSITLIENIKMLLLYQRRLKRLLWFYSV